MKTFVAQIAAVLAISAAPLLSNAATYQFNAQLSGANENPPNASPATGVSTLFYDDFGTPAIGDDKYDFSLSASGFTSSVTGYHIHGLATPSQNAPVRVSLDAPPFESVFFGSTRTLLVGGNDVTPPASIPAGNGFSEMTFLSALRAGLTYVNVHSTAFPGGEARGQLNEVAAIPEPETYALMLAGLGLVGFAARLRRKSLPSTAL